MAARADFEAGFSRSRRGNLWRLFEGKTRTVFRRRDDYFGWCIATDESKKFSAQGYEFEGDALAALTDALGIGLRDS